MSQLFDAHVRAENSAAYMGLHGQLHGALFFGSAAAESHAFALQQPPGGIWRHAASVNALIAPGDPRYPPNAPDVIDLDVNDAEFARLLNAPLHTWFPLAGAPSPHAIRLNLPPNGGPIPLVKKLVRAFPRKLFLVDAFRHGPGSDWIPQVRLAESPNVFVTTLGLQRPPSLQWPDKAEIDAAIHYLIGEVGAGKLLFASGSNLEHYAASEHFAWLESITSLDKAQRQLVAWTNAAEFFATK